uniref:hypothetical protein n=1 Tax=Aeromonas media TaxID=651 RepID=UPI001F1D5692
PAFKIRENSTYEHLSFSGGLPPVAMNFGQQARFTLKSTPLCRVLEVVIHTDRGDAGYTFE